jgi:hypothetical protein
MRTWLWLLLGAMASIVSWSYIHHVLLPWEEYVNVQHGPLKAQMGDLYPRWVGTRELLINGRNPYGTEVSHEIQIAFYGHPVDQTYDGRTSKVLDEQRFAYPVYVVLLLAPTIHADFEQLQLWAAVLLTVLTAFSIWIYLAVMRWRAPPLVAAGLILLVLASPQVGQGLRLRQAGLLVAFLLAVAGWCVTRNRYFIACFVLALATIKPQVMVLCLFWFLLWSAGDLRRRWPLPAGFVITMGGLIAAGELLLPGWPRYFLAGLGAYRKYFPTTSPLRLILGDWVGGIFSLLAMVALLVFSWTRRKAAAESPEFVEVLALFLLTTALVLPLLTPFNQTLLLLPVMILIRNWSGLPRLGRLGFVALVAWPSISSLALLAYRPRLDSLNNLPLLPTAPVLAFPFVVAWLMWVRQAQPQNPVPISG